MQNPWNLSPLHCRTMDALVEHGSVKAAAHSLGVPEKSVTSRVERIRLKMGLHYDSYYKHILLWDRFRRPKG